MHGIRHSRRLVSCQLQELHLDLTTRIDRKYPRARYVDAPIRQRIRDPVSKATVKRCPWTFAKQSLNISKASHLEYLGFAHDDLTVRAFDLVLAVITTFALGHDDSDGNKQTHR